jgi:hypothetical protein
MKVEIEVELLRDLVEAAGYVATFYNSLSQGETREYHDDWNAVEYLASEAFSIEQRGRAVLEAVEQTRALDAFGCSCGSKDDHHTIACYLGQD